MRRRIVCASSAAQKGKRHLKKNWKNRPTCTSKSSLLRNFWFMVSAYVLMALRKTLTWGESERTHEQSTLTGSAFSIGKKINTTGDEQVLKDY